MRLHKDKNQMETSIENARFYQVTSIDEHELDKYDRIPFTEVAGMAAILAELSPAARTVDHIQRIPVEGLWVGTFPDGISGSLARFKDGSGFTGTIVNSHGFAGQVHWNKVKFISSVQSVTVPISPINIFAAVAMVGVNHKLDQIRRQGEEFQWYLETAERNTQAANLNALKEICGDYRYKYHSELWRSAKMNILEQILIDTDNAAMNWQSRILKIMERHDLVHRDKDTLKMINKVREKMCWYQLSEKIYALAKYLEIWVEGDFSKVNLDNVIKGLYERDNEYKRFFHNCYDHLKHSMKTTVEYKALGRKSDERTEVVKALYHLGSDFSHTGAMRFVDYIKDLNSPKVIMFDQKYVYINRRKYQ